ncbi:hypothetical protein F8G81_14095 [Arthrobacter sp. CDRTa11]|uniref:hypothetical protein n=1 Tax=Arthrobacter sp. CDRTa11 TaxID=2651199 RepID=UPI0022658FC3|nr:hypothetical protein [Arthrobacter sp. CDRTa11]UZX03619.1 hypothetical protein F8G81_14095 [Arthrobacter sp. CDRTa11]
MIHRTGGPVGGPVGGLRRRRRRLLVWSGLPVLLGLCLAAKLITAGYLAGAAAHAFDARDSEAVAAAAAGLRTANFFETHKAPFAEGDALVLAGDFTGARQRFEEALAQAAPDDECVIRVNLVLSIERLGDARLAAEDTGAAGKLFDDGLAVVDGAPEGCFPPAAGAGEAGGEAGGDAAGDAAADAGQKLEQAEQRLKQKSEEAKDGNSQPQQPGTDAGQPPSEPDAGSETQLEQLKDSTRESQRQRSDGKERDEYLRDDDYGPGPDRPW